MAFEKGNDIKALCGGNTVFTYDIDNFFRVNNEPFNLSHLLEYGNIASDFLGVQGVNPIELDFDIQRYLKFIIDLTGAYPTFEDETFNTNSIMLSIINFEEKITIILGISKDLNNKFKANEIIKDLVAIAGGNGGGGQPWFAMGGATNQNNPEIAKKIVEFIRLKINE